MEMHPTAEVVNERRTNWWLVGGGIVLVLFAFGTFAFPLIFLGTLTVLAGFGFLVTGISGVATFVRSRGLPGAVWTLVLAVLDFIVGAMMLMHPVVLAPVIPWSLGIVFIGFGIVEIVGTTPLCRLMPESRPITIVSGIMAALVGVMFLIWPESLSIWIAAFAAVRGITLIVMGFLSRT